MVWVAVEGGPKQRACAEAEKVPRPPNARLHKGKRESCDKLVTSSPEQSLRLRPLSTGLSGGLLPRILEKTLFVQSLFPVQVVEGCRVDHYPC